MSETKEAKRYAARYGQHYSIVMKPSVTQVVNGTPVTTPGKTIVFKNGIYETIDKEEQKFLESCEQYGRDFQEVTSEVNSALQAKSLEAREKEIEEREADVERREMALRGQGNEEGAGVESSESKDGKDTEEKKDENKTGDQNKTGTQTQNKNAGGKGKDEASF